MPKAELWSRRAQAGSVGYATLYGVPTGPRPAAVRGPARPGQAVRGPARPGQAERAVGATPYRIPTPGARSRARSIARQRQVLAVLLVCLAIPALVAVATGSTAAWWVVLALLPLVCTYVAVLFRARRVQAEREFNVAFLGGSNVATMGLEEIFSARTDTRGPRQPALGAAPALPTQRVAAAGR